MPKSSTTPALQEKFFAAFRLCGKINAAARKAKIGRETVRQWRLNDPTFPARFAAQRIDLVELLEDSYVGKALRADGEKANWNLLKANAPEKYRESSDLNLSAPVPLEITLTSDRGASDEPPKT